MEEGEMMRSQLKYPLYYRFLNNLVGASSLRKFYVSRHVRPVHGNFVLDLGCGPGDIVTFMPIGVMYYGLDINPEHIKAAQKRFGSRGCFECKDVTLSINGPAENYDIVLADGFLYHLSDIEVIGLCNAAKEFMKSNGRFVSLDGCWVPRQSFLCRKLLEMDRGKFVRTAEQYVALANQGFPNVKTFIYERLLKIPYNHIVMECSL